MKLNGTSIVAIVVGVASLLYAMQAPAWGDEAGVPYLDNCEAWWEGLCNDGVAFVCPAGDGPSYVRVVIRDYYGDAVPDATVWFAHRHEDDGGTFIRGRGLGECAPTDINGFANLHPTQTPRHEEESDTSCHYILSAVNVAHDDVYFENFPIAGSRHYWRTSDLISDGHIIGGNNPPWGDFEIFADDYNMGDLCRTDYNGDDDVNVSDYLIFTTHLADHHELKIEPAEYAFVFDPEVPAQWDVALQIWGGDRRTLLDRMARR